jgi:phospholipid-binding lipoprotein MlaA
MSRSVALALSIMTTLWFFYGCAASRPAAEHSSHPEFPAVQHPQEVQGTVQPAAALSEEEKLLLEDDLDWEDDPLDDFYSVADPLEGFNRAMFVVNDRLYFWLLKPVARGYRAAMPRPARSAVRNFFVNIKAPVRIVNNILQGRFRDAEAEWARFLLNSTVGVLGFGDPASTHPKLALRDEDLGQTLAVYGLGDGFFLFLPILGPSTLRDSAGMTGDWFLSPTFYVEPLELSLGISGYNQVNRLSFHIGDYESLKNAALDPYVSIRDGYIQMRRAQIKR